MKVVKLSLHCEDDIVTIWQETELLVESHNLKLIQKLALDVTTNEPQCCSLSSMKANNWLQRQVGYIKEVTRVNAESRWTALKRCVSR